MIDVGCYGESAKDGLVRVERDVLHFQPDLVIICCWDGNTDDMRKIIQKIRDTGSSEILLRTPNPVVAPNIPPVTPSFVASEVWPNSDKGELAKKIIALGKELGLPVVDHYRLWVEVDRSHIGPPAMAPCKLWMRMPYAMHPGPLGHVAFFRDLAPYFGFPTQLSWEF